MAKRRTVSGERRKLGIKLPVVVPLQSVLEDKDRLTMIFSLRHEQKGEPVRGVEAPPYQEFLTERMEMYTRSVTVTEKWAPIVDDSCWVSSDKIRMVVVQNKEGLNPQLNPTEEEKEEISKKIVELSYNKSSTYSDTVTPGFTLPKTPGNGAVLYARCQSGTASCRITVVPK